MRTFRNCFQVRSVFVAIQALALALIVTFAVPSPAEAAGPVVAWGDNDSLQCQIPPAATNVIAVTGGGAHTLALKAGGTVLAWGFDASGQTDVPPALTNVVAISGGGSYSLALKQNGSVAAWGRLTNVPPTLTNAVAISAGWSHALALTSAGAVVAWGSQTNVPEGLSNVVAIAAGTDQSLALFLDGTVVAWGDNSFGKATVPDGLTNVIEIAAGQDHCLALQRDGTIVAWGRNDRGQTNVPPNISRAVGISAGALHSVAVLADGTVVAWGDNAFSQTAPIPSGGGYIEVGAGAYHSLAVRGDGTPFLLSPPVSQTVMASQTAVFRVVATGVQPLFYQWLLYGTNIPGASNPILTLPNVQFTNAGPYTVRVTNMLGSTLSLPAILTVIGDPPMVTTPPQDQTVVCGEEADFSVEVSGSTPFTYQWQFQGSSISNATQATLTLSNTTPSQAGQYSVLVSNAYGWASSSATLTVTVETPSITSLLAANGIQGDPFSYTIEAIHTPLTFGALYLPDGLSIDPASGVISGIPAENGSFAVVITAANACSSDTQILELVIFSSVPVITSASQAAGTELAPFAYQITATGLPTSFGADNLPVGLMVDPASGLISGAPTYSGGFDSTISASNQFGLGSANLHFTFAPGAIDNLNIGNVTYKYSSPYLLDFQFSLYTLTDTNDPNSAAGIAVDSRLLSATCLEDDIPIGSETDSLVAQGNSKLVKIELILDFTASIASLANGDADGNGISDAVDFMVAGAQDFVRQQSADTQIGVFEFHRDDMSPSNVVSLTTDKARVNQAIGGIWTNYVQGFSSGSRCWDALANAVGSMGPKNRDEQHYVIFVSDGRDESSGATITNVMAAAATFGVKIFCIGFGPELNPTPLQIITSATAGNYYTATNASDLATKFGQVTKDTKSQYNLRWATLKRAAPFMPSFQITYQGLTATSPTNPFTIGFTNIDTTVDPPTTNSSPSTTNFIIAYYFPVSNAAPVLRGSLRLAPNAEVQPTGIDLRATYIPRYIRQLRLHYRPNWPCTPTMQNTGIGQLLNGWSMSQTNDGTGGNWLLLSSPNPNDTGTSLPFASFGRLITFTFQDVVNQTNAFSLFAIDNSIYSNILAGGQSFTNENFGSFLTNYPALPHGTPVPWLMSFGFSGNFTNAELLDPDHDGMPNWKEYWSNTNPTNAASAFLVRSATRQTDGRFRITFSTSTNRLYQVQASTDLTTWQIIQDDIPGINQDVTVVDTRYLPNLDKIFYRVLVY